MSEIVSPDEIQKAVGGAERDYWLHIGYANTPLDRFYIMHAHTCLSQYTDLRECPYSKALDKQGISADWWEDWYNRPVYLALSHKGFVVPSHNYVRDSDENN